LRDVGSKRDGVELREDSVDLELGGVDIELNEGLDLELSGAKFGDDPSPGDLVAGVECLKSLEPGESRSLCLTRNESLLAWVCRCAKLCSWSAINLANGKSGGQHTGLPDRELIGGDRRRDLADGGFWAGVLKCGAGGDWSREAEPVTI